MRYAVALLFLFTFCGKRAKPPVSYAPECMENVLAVDDSLGKLRNTDCKTLSLSTSISKYTSAMKAVDFTGCPEDFTTAFTAHRTAWDEMIPVTDKHPALRGEMHDLFKRLESSSDSVMFKKRLARIWSTWAEVEKTARKK